VALGCCNGTVGRCTVGDRTVGCCAAGDRTADDGTPGRCAAGEANPPVSPKGDSRNAISRWCKRRDWETAEPLGAGGAAVGRRSCRLGGTAEGTPETPGVVGQPLAGDWPGMFPGTPRRVLAPIALPLRAGRIRIWLLPGGWADTVGGVLGGVLGGVIGGAGFGRGCGLPGSTPPRIF
jgi:hypothetical protein